MNNNPLLNNINFNNSNISNNTKANSMMNLFASLRNTQNPQAVVNNIINSNPQAKALLNQLRQSNISTKDYAMQLLRQQGIDVNSFINMANQYGIRL